MTQRNLMGKATAYSRPSDDEMRQCQEIALETAREAVDYVLANLGAGIDAAIDRAPTPGITGTVYLFGLAK